MTALTLVHDGPLLAKTAPYAARASTAHAAQETNTFAPVRCWLSAALFAFLVAKGKQRQIPGFKMLTCAPECSAKKVRARAD